MQCAMLRRRARLEELFGKRGLQNFVYEVAVLDLQRRAAGYLELLSDGAWSFQLTSPALQRSPFPATFFLECVWLCSALDCSAALTCNGVFCVH
eukprot:3098023-Rhodomonas_salina.1